MANFINDNKMTYDLDMHRYVLEEDYVNNYYNVNLTDILINKTDVNPDAVSKVFLRRVSNVFYNFIYSTAPDVSKAEYYFSLPKFRDGILEAMLELAYAFLINNKDNTILLDELDKKPMPSGVETICLNRGLFNRHHIKIYHDYQKGRGVDY